MWKVDARPKRRLLAFHWDCCAYVLAVRERLDGRHGDVYMRFGAARVDTGVFLAVCGMDQAGVGWNIWGVA